MSEEKKIIIDEDWKSQVEAEKEAAKQAPTQASAPDPPEESGGAANDSPANDAGAASAGGAPGSPEGGDPPMPPASIGMLISSLATEAMIAMGHFPHPITGDTTPQRDQAKYLIDTLDVIKQKTAGNLTDDEANALEGVLHQLRMAFVTNPAPPQPPGS